MEFDTSNFGIIHFKLKFLFSQNNALISGINYIKSATLKFNLLKEIFFPHN